MNIPSFPRMLDDFFGLVTTKQPTSFKALSWAPTFPFPSSHKYLLFPPCPVTRPIQPAPSVAGNLSAGRTIPRALELPTSACGPIPALPESFLLTQCQGPFWKLQPQASKMFSSRVMYPLICFLVREEGVVDLLVVLG